eukprot:scaffold320017_cov116-Cyclotella_meneghiniana.AAC.1
MMCVCADSVIFIKQSYSTNRLQRQLAHDHDPHNNNADDVLTVVESSLPTLVFALIYTRGRNWLTKLWHYAEGAGVDM